MPSKVKADYAEGLKDMENGCFKSACVMFRRALQNAALKLGTNKKDKLQDQIDDLENRKIITSDLKEWAHEIRMVGNDGAHPFEDQFDEIGKEDALEIRDFLAGFVDYVFVMKKKFEERKKRKS